MYQDLSYLLDLLVLPAMKRFSGYLRIIIQGLASTIFVLQMEIAVQKYYSKPTVTSLGEKHLSHLNKPVAIAVCKLKQFDHDRLQSIGYKWESLFFSGQLNAGKKHVLIVLQQCSSCLY